MSKRFNHLVLQLKTDNYTDIQLFAGAWGKHAGLWVV